MKYKIIDGIVSRNIDRVYFLINVYDKKCFIEGNLFTTNEIGYELFNSMKEANIFTITEIVDELINKLVDFNEEMRSEILLDIQQFVKKLKEIGYIEEVK